MKIPIFSCCIIASLALSASAEDLPGDVQLLIKQRSDAIARIDKSFVRELEKLKIKYTKLADLEAAIAIDTLIKNSPVKDVAAVPSDPELDGTSWEFGNKSGRLGELKFLAGGKIESKDYPGSTWTRLDKDTIRFEYKASERPFHAGGHVTFKFHDSARTKMSGVQSELVTIQV